MTTKRNTPTTATTTEISEFKFNAEVSKALKEAFKLVFSELPRSPGQNNAANMVSNIGTILIDNSESAWTGEVKNLNTGKITEISVRGSFLPGKDITVNAYVYGHKHKQQDMVARWQAIQTGKISDTMLTGYFLYFLAQWSKGQNNSYATYLTGYILHVVYPIVRAGYEIKMSLPGCMQDSAPVMCDEAVAMWKFQHDFIAAKIALLDNKSNSSNKQEDKPTLTATKVTEA